MTLEKVFKVYGKELPDRSSFRADSKFSFRDIIKTYKSWGRFMAAYNNFVHEKRIESTMKIETKKVADKKETKKHGTK